MNDTVTQIVRETPAGAITATLSGDIFFPCIEIKVNGMLVGILEYDSPDNRFNLCFSNHDLYYNAEPPVLKMFPEKINFMGYDYPCRYLDVPIKVEGEMELHTYTIITPALDEEIQGLIKDEDPEGLEWLSEKYWVVENQGLSDEKIIKEIQSMNSD